MSIEINITDNIVEVTPTEQQVDINITENPIEVNVTDAIIVVAQTGLPGPQGPAGPGVPIGGTAGQVLAKNSSTNYDTLWINAGVGTVTSINASGVSGISVSGGPITSSGTLLITNTAPDQVVSLTGAGTTLISGTYPTFTITSNDEYDGTVTSVNASGGTGISVSGGPVTSSGTLTITNTAPDQVVALTGTGTTSISGTYPNFTINSDDQFDGTVTSVGLISGTGIAVSGGPITSSGNITVTNTAPDQIVILTGTGTTSISGTYPSFTINSVDSNVGTVTSIATSAPITGGTITASGTIGITQSSATGDGYLSSTDWSTFNNKQGTLTLTTTGTSGAATLVGNTLNIPQYEAEGNYVTTATTLTINGVTYDLSANRSWSVGTVTSVAMTVPAAFAVAGSPITGAGTLAVTAIGTSSQYIRGDGSLATIPSTSSGGSSVNYYLNGSVAASVAGYQQMSNSAIIGAGTDFTLVGNGLIAQFLTDVANPNRLLIPGGAWNFEMYFNMSSGGGNAKFYVELLKYDGTTFTSIASSSAIPESITGGTTIDLYLTSLAVPETVLLTSDRLAVRVYIVDNSGGRTARLHTENSHLCEIITTFAGGIAALNGLTANTQYFATGTSGSDFNILSVSDTHTFNLPTASATNRGALSSTDWTTFNSKQNAITLTTTGSSGSSTLVGDTLNVPTYTLSGLGGVPTTRSITINGTAQDLSADRTFSVGTVTSVAALTLGTTGTDLSSTVATGTTTPVITLNVPTASATNRGALSSADWSTFNGKQAAGNYITALTGEATATGPGSVSITLTTSAVTGKLLTGLNLVGGGTIAATDSILQAFGKVQNQISGMVGGVTFQGVWNASTNTPTLTSSVGTKGYYYIVDVAGSTNLNGITDWKIGDWAIYNGTTWDKVDNTDAVSSVNGFTGAVSLTTANISEVTNLYYTEARVSANTDVAANTAARHNAVTIGTANGLSLSTQALSLALASTSVTGALSSTDWNTFNNKTSNTGTVTSVGLSSATSGVTIGSTPVTTSGTITLAIATASGSQNGLLSSTDWTTFNGKYNLPSLTSGSVLFSNGSTIAQDNANFFWDDTNNRLGIGTTSPAYKLTIEGASTNYSTSPSVAFYDSVVVANARNWMLGNIATDYGSFNIASSTTQGGVPQTPRLTITKDGNVGIGTTSPSEKLHISSGASSTEIRIENSTTSAYIRSQTDNLNFYFNGAERMRITSGGNILIGTTTDNTVDRLQVNGSGYFTDNLSIVKSGNALLRVHASTNTTPVVDIEMMRGTNTTWGADAYGDYRFRNSAGKLTIDYGDTGVTTTRLTLDASGNLGLGSTSLTGYSFRIQKNIEGGTLSYGISNEGTVQSGVSGFAINYNSSSLIAASTTLSNYIHYNVTHTSIGAGSAVTNLFGFRVNSTNAIAANNYAFYGDIASGSGRWNIYMNGTANNYLNGALLVGNSVDDGINKLQVTGSGKFTTGVDYNVLKPTTTTSASTATLTPNLASGDTFNITAQAAGLTIASPIGTFVSNQKLMIRIEDDGTARAITWTTGSGGSYRASTDLPLPTTTIATKTMYLGFIWNSTDSRWDMIAFLNNF